MFITELINNNINIYIFGLFYYYIKKIFIGIEPLIYIYLVFVLWFTTRITTYTNLKNA